MLFEINRGSEESLQSDSTSTSSNYYSAHQFDDQEACLVYWDHGYESLNNRLAGKNRNVRSNNSSAPPGSSKVTPSTRRKSQQGTGKRDCSKAEIPSPSKGTITLLGLRDQSSESQPSLSNGLVGIRFESNNLVSGSREERPLRICKRRKDRRQTRASSDRILTKNSSNYNQSVIDPSNLNKLTAISPVTVAKNSAAFYALASRMNSRSRSALKAPDPVTNTVKSNSESRPESDQSSRTNQQVFDSSPSAIQQRCAKSLNILNQQRLKLKNQESQIKPIQISPESSKTSSNSVPSTTTLKPHSTSSTATSAPATLTKAQPDLTDKSRVEEDDPWDAFLDEEDEEFSVQLCKLADCTSENPTSNRAIFSNLNNSKNSMPLNQKSSIDKIKSNNNSNNSTNNQKNTCLNKNSTTNSPKQKGNAGSSNAQSKGLQFKFIGGNSPQLRNKNSTRLSFDVSKVNYISTKPGIRTPTKPNPNKLSNNFNKIINNHNTGKINAKDHEKVNGRDEGSDARKQPFGVNEMGNNNQERRNERADQIRIRGGKEDENDSHKRVEGYGTREDKGKTDARLILDKGSKVKGLVEGRDLKGGKSGGGEAEVELLLSGLVDDDLDWNLND
ncbi:hypothetical protein BY996DRAFT_6719131 [Phakopsora pachyrhizi]|uniref:Expressed protein n=1 Tax=Phakopsora pachyrhizi TaxID=170000 RepID=A0AAV0AQM2_PHAPC|nr:hypothetical protein BY996DRAFT_6719131 [Phakopsora pachyrhizi]CAH7671313.1 expressed protein [Phakopsora pachyrhizi]